MMLYKEKEMVSKLLIPNRNENGRSPKRKKVAVLGGGIASLTTALAMTGRT